MARPLRIEYAGAWYHVTSRGSERGAIFLDEKDRIRFLDSLKESIERFKVEVHCYVLMNNHFHFLLRTLEANLSRFMQRFNTAYTTYYNLRHHRAGHLYQGRFKAIVVDADEYLKELSRYLHLNPVRMKRYKELAIADKAKILKAYKWSSLPGYLGLKKQDTMVTYGTVLGFMGGNSREGKERYCDFVLSGLRKGIKNPFEEAQAEAVLGGEKFREWIRKTFIDGCKWVRKDQPQTRLLRGSIPVEEIARMVAAEYGVKPNELLKARCAHREARRVLIEMSYRFNMSGKALQQLGRELGGIGGDAVAHTHERVRSRMANDKRLWRRIEKIREKLGQISQ
jgi:putative transposase